MVPRLRRLTTHPIPKLLSSGPRSWQLYASFVSCQSMLVCCQTYVTFRSPAGVVVISTVAVGCVPFGSEAVAVIV